MNAGRHANTEDAALSTDDEVDFAPLHSKTRHWARQLTKQVQADQNGNRKVAVSHKDWNTLSNKCNIQLDDHDVQFSQYQSAQLSGGQECYSGMVDPFLDVLKKR